MFLAEFFCRNDFLDYSASGVYPEEQPGGGRAARPHPDRDRADERRAPGPVGGEATTSAPWRGRGRSEQGSFSIKSNMFSIESRIFIITKYFSINSSRRPLR